MTLTEIRYTIARKYDRDTANEYLDWLTDLGIETVDVGDAWLGASEYVLRYNSAPDDAFALATAEHVEATRLVGGDNGHDDVSAVPTRRFRDGPG